MELWPLAACTQFISSLLETAGDISSESDSARGRTVMSWISQCGCISVLQSLYVYMFGSSHC